MRPKEVSPNPENGTGGCSAGAFRVKSSRCALSTCPEVAVGFDEPPLKRPTEPKGDDFVALSPNGEGRFVVDDERDDTEGECAAVFGYPSPEVEEFVDPEAGNPPNPANMEGTLPAELAIEGNKNEVVSFLEPAFGSGACGFDSTGCNGDNTDVADILDDGGGATNTGMDGNVEEYGRGARPDSSEV